MKKFSAFFLGVVFCFESALEAQGRVRPPIVAMFGDSIMACAGSYGSGPWGITFDSSPAAVVTRRFAEEPEGSYWHNATAISLAIPGLGTIDWAEGATYTRSCNMLPKPDDVISLLPGLKVLSRSCASGRGMMRYYRSALPRRARHAIVLLGPNDPKEKENGAEETVERLKKIRTYLGRRRVRVLLASPLRVNSVVWPNLQGFLDRVSTIMREQGLVSPGLDLNQVEEPTTDGIHLWAVGCEDLGRLFYEALKVSHP